MKICGVVVRVDTQVYMGRFKSVKEAEEYKNFINASKETGGIIGVLDHDYETHVNTVINVPAEQINLVFVEELYS